MRHWRDPAANRHWWKSGAERVRSKPRRQHHCLRTDLQGNAFTCQFDRVTRACLRGIDPRNIRSCTKPHSARTQRRFKKAVGTMALAIAQANLAQTGGTARQVALPRTQPVGVQPAFENAP